MTLTNSTVSDNRTNGVGGDGGGIRSGGAVTLTNSIVSGNTTNGDASNGGGIWGDGAVTLTDSTVSDNRASSDGGGILLGFNGGTITNSTITNNTADADNNGTGNGGGIFFGGIFNNGTLAITNSTISGNRANNNDGGGIANFGDTTTLTLTDVTVSNNTAGDDGGGIVNFGTLNILNSTLSNNTALSASSANSGGGAILNTTTGTATLTNTTVSGNTALNGGGIRNDGTLTLTNATVTNNRATGGFGGGGIANTALPVPPFTPASLTIRNTILAGNFDTSGNNRVDLGNAGTVTDAGNNLIGSTANIGVPVTFAASTLLNANPQLAPLGNYGGTTQTHALLPNSPALNAGNNAGVAATDQRGATRIFGGTVDIGAFEFQGFSLATVVGSTPQNTTVNTNFSQPLSVRVTENFANSPISNVQVTFSSPTTGASGLFGGLTTTTATTDVNGIAQVAIRANTVAGTFTSTGSLGALTPANFALTNNPDVPFSITTQGGTPQNAIVNTNFTNQLQVLVADQFGNVVPNSIVTFSSPTTGASGLFGGLTTTTATTDVNGIAQVAIRANTVAGTFTSIGSLGALTPANFALLDLR